MQLSLADFEGLLVILLVIFLTVAILKKATKFILFCVSLLCLLQVGFMLSKTSLNDKIPLDRYFKYDILGSITQIWEDTDKEQLKQDINETANTIVNVGGEMIDIITSSLQQEEDEPKNSISTESIEEVPIENSETLSATEQSP